MAAGIGRHIFRGTSTPLLSCSGSGSGALVTLTTSTPSSSTPTSLMVGVNGMNISGGVRSLGAGAVARHRTGSIITSRVVRAAKKERDPDLPPFIQDPVAFSVSPRRLKKGQIGRHMAPVCSNGRAALPSPNRMTDSHKLAHSFVGDAKNGLVCFG
jgi:hypothetical protein